MDIEDIINYENECVYVDFKLIEYSTDTKGELIKDVMAFANADYIGDRYIIIGIKKKGNKIEFNNIENPEDGASIQQKINSCIEPELDISYSPFCSAGNNFVILTIKNPTNPPYIIVKDIIRTNNTISAKKGECWIRKGERKEIANRKDYDRMYERLLDSDFKGIINIDFVSSKSEVLVVTNIDDASYPSDEASDELRYNIELKRKEEPQKGPNKNTTTYFSQSIDINNLLFYKKKALSEFSLEELEDKLQNVKTDYYDADLLYLFENKSELINFSIINQGSEYLKDVTIEVIIPNIPGLMIFKKFLVPPKSRLLADISIPSYEELNYPYIEENENNYIIVEKIGNLKHKIPNNTFKVPFRASFGYDLIGKDIEIKCTLFGENSPNPIIKNLKIKAMENIGDNIFD